MADYTYSGLDSYYKIEMIDGKPKVIEVKLPKQVAFLTASSHSNLLVMGIETDDHMIYIEVVTPNFEKVAEYSVPDFRTRDFYANLIQVSPKGDKIAIVGQIYIYRD